MFGGSGVLYVSESVLGLDLELDLDLGIELELELELVFRRSDPTFSHG